MYRILIARNGYYYIQQEVGPLWAKVGGFFNTKSGARRFIADHRSTYNNPRYNKVVGYY